MSNTEKLKQKLLAKKKENSVVGLSTGSTLLNLACSGDPDYGFVQGGYFFFVGDSNSGKAQPLHCRVLTPTGWATMGSLAVGDEVVDPDGGVGYVVAIHPQGIKKTYKITTSDGGSTECCADHLWLTQTSKQRTWNGWTVKSMERINKDITNKGTKHFIPITSPVEFKMVKKDRLPIPSYMLGALLGNGHFGEKRLGLSTAEKEIQERIRALLISGYKLVERDRRGDLDIVKTNTKGRKLTNYYRDKVKELGLHNVRSSSKFIPKQYLCAPLEDRIALLHGLMDTDGTVSVQELATEYSTVSKQLMEGIRELVRSLGGTAKVTVKKAPKYTYKGQTRTGQDCFRVWVRLPAYIPTFSLSRKKAIHEKTKEASARLRGSRKITEIRDIGDKECQCITVSTKRNIYITDDYIVTHNSWSLWTAFAEACRNPDFANYRLFLNDPENGSHMDVERFFGKKTKERTKVVQSPSLDHFYNHVDDLIREGKPFLYALDSMDSLEPLEDQEHALKAKKAIEKGKDAGGSYGTAKAKMNSKRLPGITAGLRDTGSILLIVSQTRDNIGFGAQFNPKTRSGGKSLKFYCQLELWTACTGKLHKTVGGKKIQTGITTEVHVKKNRLTGRDRKIEFPIYHSSGIDDTGSQLDFLLSWKDWKQIQEPLAALGLDLTENQEKLIKRIEEEGLEEKLKETTSLVWKAVETAAEVQRKPRYE